MTTYAQHWKKRMAKLKRMGLLVDTGIVCPEDNLPLYSFRSDFGESNPKTVGEWEGARIIKEIDENWARCDNGHRHDL